jgi:hypothetical protein
LGFWQEHGERELDLEVDEVRAALASGLRPQGVSAEAELRLRDEGLLVSRQGWAAGVCFYCGLASDDVLLGVCEGCGR